MRLLLDSNALIWATANPGRLSRRATQLIQDRENLISVSLVSLWEMTLKIAKGRLPEVGSSIQYMLDEIREQQFELLPLRPEHLLALGRLESHHRDPFDRLLIAQGIAEGLPVVTSDVNFRRYPVQTLW